MVEGIVVSAYTVFRKIHLYSGLILLTFVVMYFITGYALIHHEWFPESEPVKTTRIEPLSFAGVGDPDTYSLYLQERFELRGKRRQPNRFDDGRWRFRYFRPGTTHEALVAADGRNVAITTRDGTTYTTMAGFHALHGYGGGWLYDVWAVLYDLASLSMIVFAISGIYLWYRLTRRKLVGWIFLGLSYGYAGVTILYLMYAP
jgi:hypothetical protein